MNKQELMNNTLTSRKELDSTIGKVRENQMSLIVLHGDWSVKDLIGHLGFWESRIASVYEILRHGKSPDDAEELDILNARSITEMRGKSLEVVRVFEKNAFNQILALISQAADPELFDPGHFVWTRGTSFSELIGDNTWRHYEEHLPELNAWLKRIA